MKFKDLPKEKVPPYHMPAALILALASSQRPSVTDETIEEIEDYEEDLWKLFHPLSDLTNIVVNFYNKWPFLLLNVEKYFTKFKLLHLFYGRQCRREWKGYEYSHLSNSKGGWNKHGGDAKVPELLNKIVGINMEGGIFWKKLIHNCNK